ncbi:MAG: hypothetical protein L0207_02680 [Chlamydiae bacterium]|nr:hypothetical protein [Chlamydiota bacterium]
MRSTLEVWQTGYNNIVAELNQISKESPIASLTGATFFTLIGMRDLFRCSWISAAIYFRIASALRPSLDDVCEGEEPNKVTYSGLITSFQDQTAYIQEKWLTFKSTLDMISILQKTLFKKKEEEPKK